MPHETPPPAAGSSATSLPAPDSAGVRMPATASGTAGLAPAALQALGLSPTALQRAERVLQDDISSARLPGAVVLLSRRGQIAWHEAFGKRDPASPDPMRRDAIFRIYSMTKPIVSLAVMRLVEEGRLSLSDPISRWLPAFAAPRVLEAANGAAETVLRPASRPITVQDLLRHTAGLSYEFIAQGPLQQAYLDADLGSRKRDNAAFCDVLAKLPLTCDPGARWEYSRATDVLGRLVEIVADEPLGVHLARRFFQPLGMVDTGFFVPPAQHHRIAEPFPVDPDTGDEVRLLDPCRAPAFESGGGGLMSTSGDYARFLQMLVDKGRTAAGERLVARKTLELMTADHLGTIPAASDLLPPGHGFGLGFAVRTHAGLATVPGSVGQYFWSGIAGTTFWVDPKEEIFAILMTQAPGRRDHYRQLFRSLVYAALD